MMLRKLEDCGAGDCNINDRQNGRESVLTNISYNVRVTPTTL